MPRLAPPFVLIDDAASGRGTDHGALLFCAPKRIITCCQAQDVQTALSAIDDAVAAGQWVAGYCAFELGYALEPKLAPFLSQDPSAPLIWMGVFDAPQTFNGDDVRTLMHSWSQAASTVTMGSADIEREAYLNHVAQVRAHIAAGDVYQINYTFKQPFTLSGDPLALYARLRRGQRAPHGAVIATGDRHILSLSPELFVACDGAHITTRPMKGTAPRAADPQHDEALQDWLGQDEKSRAENLMIVDLMRNDLSRIADVGSVRVSSLFEVETYPTVHQMTSTIEATLKSGTTIANTLRALFPCGSVTGAPKVKAMELIHSLEAGPRGVYTGAVGYAGVGGKAVFNVAIRTLDIDAQGQGELGIGSGIVFDSDAEDEWDECHVKARFLTQPVPEFALLETLKWTRTDGFALLDRHLARLEKSAAYFSYPYNAEAVMEALNASVDKQDQDALRLRLTVDGWGRAVVEGQPLPRCDDTTQWRFAMAETPVDMHSPFVFHKTTNRAFYDDARAALEKKYGCDEVLFVNQNGELTEGSFTNVFIEKDGQLRTPSLSCGVLAGTLRAELIAQGQAMEAVLTNADLRGADRVYFGNSVRGLIPALPIETL